MQSHHIFCIFRVFRVFRVFRGQPFCIATVVSLSFVTIKKKRETGIPPRSAPLSITNQLHTHMQFQTNCAWWRQVGVWHAIDPRLAT